MATSGSNDRDQHPEGAAFRVLPPVADLVRSGREVDPRLDERALTGLVQDFLSRIRHQIANGARPGRVDVERELRRAVARLATPRLAPVLNATGVVIHTNLGRAAVSLEAAAAMASAAASAVSLELDPATNKRGGRMDEISDLMRLLTGAGATLVVNNGAAALLLVLAAIAAGGEVIVSRGEAIEIGGGFRIPEVIEQSGARLVEIGTTNRTYMADYAAATTDATAAYLAVHPSNFSMTGFVHRTAIADLVRLGTERNVPVVEDLGSGALLDTGVFGLAHEPTIADSVAAGVTLVIASGDKLVGGPQAGIICGDAEWVERVARHPLARAVRADKTCLAGLAATLRHYIRGEAETTIPVWRMIAAPVTTIRDRVERARSGLSESGITATVADVRSSIGGGALPGQLMPSYALALTGNVDDLGRWLRLGQPAVFGRVERNRLLLDFRTVLPEDDDGLIEAVKRAWQG